MKGNNGFNTPGGRARPGSAAAAAFAAMTMLFSTLAGAQVPVDESGNPVGSDTAAITGATVENPAASGDGAMTSAELETLVGPIALYPDDLLAIVLPASTYPLEIVQAARYLERVETDPSLEPDEAWDDSVVALLNYPDVLDMMNEDLDWTWQLGDAVVQQQGDVILAIESFRDRAYAAGNLQTDEHQVVSRGDDGIIEIEPVEDDVIYVPYYEPERVVYYSPAPVYHYYPRAYPVYYYPYPTGHYLTSGFFWGVTTAFTIGWATDHLHVYHHSYRGHPYYGYRYYYGGSYWRRPSINVYNTWYVDTRSPYYKNRYRRGDYWRPRHHRSGARPSTRIVHERYDGTRQEQYRNRTRRTAADYDFRERRTKPDDFNNRFRRSSTGDTDRRGTGQHTRRNDTVADGRSNPARAGDANRGNRGTNRDEIRFRPRNNGAFTASRQPRLTADRSETRRSANDKRRSDRTRPASFPRREAGVSGQRATARTPATRGTSVRVEPGTRVRRNAVRTSNRSRSNAVSSTTRRSIAPAAQRVTVKRAANRNAAASRSKPTRISAASGGSRPAAKRSSAPARRANLGRSRSSVGQRSRNRN